MLDSERKMRERDTYDHKQNMDRPSYGSFFDPELYRHMFAREFDQDMESWARTYITNKKVLVVGAGAAEIKLALNYTEDISSINISELAVESLKRQFPQVHHMLGDAEALKLDETYDVLMCRSILHHLHPIRDVLRRFHDVLVPNGILFVSAEPGLLNPFAAFARRFSPTQSHTPGERPFVFSQFRKLVEGDFKTEKENHYFLVSMLAAAGARRMPALLPVFRVGLDASIAVERFLRRVPGISDLYWIMAGVYRRRS